LSNTNLLSTSFVRTSFGARSFSVAAPKIWNSLPPALRMRTSPHTFRRISRRYISSRPYKPLSAFFLAPQIQLLLTIVSVYKLSLLYCNVFSGTLNPAQSINQYLLFYSKWSQMTSLDTSKSSTDHGRVSNPPPRLRDLADPQVGQAELISRTVFVAHDAPKWISAARGFVLGL